MNEMQSTQQQLTAQLGETALPIMEELSQKLPRMSTAVLCTSDGFNICSIGLDETQVGKMASLSSSLFSMADSIATNLEIDSKERKEVVITKGNILTLVTEVHHPTLKNLILLASVQDTAIGVMLMSVRYIVSVLEKQFLAESS